MDITQLSQIRKDALHKLKNSESWEIVKNLCVDIVNQECDLESIDNKLPDNEFKIEYLARKKAKLMFTGVFGDVDKIGTYIEKTKRDLS